jgi:hypothetical protein
MVMKLAAGALLALALGGYAGLYPDEKVAPQPTAPGVEISKQQGGRFIAFVGPKQQHTGPFLDVPDTNFFCLRSWLDNKTGEVAHQLYVENSYYGGPFLWNDVRDTKSNASLKFIPISRNQISCERGCSFDDEFAASLPEDYLRAHRDGFAVTFIAENNKTLEVKVPPELVTAELNAVDAVREVAAKTAANTASPARPPAPTTPPAAPPAR